MILIVRKTIHIYKGKWFIVMIIISIEKLLSVYKDTGREKGYTTVYIYMYVYALRFMRHFDFSNYRDYYRQH